MLLTTALIGVERAPLDAETKRMLGIDADKNEVEAALEALGRIRLLEKAGYAFREVKDHPAFPPPDTRPVVNKASVRDLRLILSGRFEDGLQEYLDLLKDKQLKIPPEFLPDLIEKLCTANIILERLPELGAAAEYLLDKQLVKCRASVSDWHPAMRAFRGRLDEIRRLRREDPERAPQLLRAFWGEEKVEQKLQMLSCLYEKPSKSDVDFLQSVFREKSRELRLEALTLLCLTGENDISDAFLEFYTQKLVPALKDTERSIVLKTNLPDLSEESIQPWLGVLTPSERNDWREALLFLALRLLPPESAGVPFHTLAASLGAETDPRGFCALLENMLLRPGNQSLAKAVSEYVCSDFRRAFWQSRSMAAWLNGHIEMILEYLSRKGKGLDFDNERVLRAVENYRKPWPDAFFKHFLTLYFINAGRPDAELEGRYFSLGLQTAAWYADPQTAATIKHPFADRIPREWQDFASTMQFRMQMRQNMLVVKQPNI